MATLDQFQGCMLGLALGDAFGAPHEGGPLERFVWRLIGKSRNGKLRWTKMILRGVLLRAIAGAVATDPGRQSF